MSSALARRLWFAVVAALSTAIFGRTIAFSFFYDDPAMMYQELQGESVLSVFTHPMVGGNYRPIPLTIWKLLEVLTPGWNPAVYHWVSVLIHVLSAALLFRLAWSLTGRLSAGLLAALFLALHYHSYTVGYVAAFFYQVAVSLSLAALLSYRLLLSSGSTGWRGAALPACLHAMAILSHPVSAALLPLYPLLDRFRSPLRPSPVPCRLPPWTVTVAAGGLTLVWVLSRTDSWIREGGSLGSTGWSASAAYYLQSLLSPLPPLMGRWLGVAGDAPPLPVILGGLVFLVVSATLARGLRASRLVTLGAAWLFLVAAAFVVVLPPGYVLAGPWLAYLSVPGTALVWAGLGSSLFDRLSNPHHRWSAYAVVACVLLLNLILLEHQLSLYERASRWVRTLKSRVEPWSPDASVLLVNLPAYVPETVWPLPLGVTSAGVFPDYIDPSLTIAAHGGGPTPQILSTGAAPLMVLDYAVHGAFVSPAHLLGRSLFADEIYLAWLGSPEDNLEIVTLPRAAELLRGSPYDYATALQRVRELAMRLGGIYVASPHTAEVSSGTPRVSGLARFVDPNLGWVWSEGESLFLIGNSDRALLPRSRMSRLRWMDLPEVLSVPDLRLGIQEPPRHPLRAQFQNGVELLDSAIHVDDRELVLELLWRATRPLDQSLSVFVHLVPDSGPPVPLKQADGLPLGGSYPTPLWRAGEIILDVRRMPWPAQTVHGLELRLGLYEPATGQRLPVVSSELPVQDDGLILTIPPTAD